MRSARPAVLPVLSRNDAAAIANRLRACIEAGFPQELLDAHYSHYFRWLLIRFDNYFDRGIRVSQEEYDRIKELVAVMPKSEMALRIDWAVSLPMAWPDCPGFKKTARRRGTFCLARLTFRPSIASS